MATDLPTGDAADAILKALRERYDDASERWRKTRENGAKNMRYIAGDPWDPVERKAREDAMRPCLSLDEISQYTNQVINELRAKRIGVKFAPVGNGANDQTAEFYANKWREVEYRSKAQIVYTTAVQNAIERGYGFCRLKTKFLTREGERFNQELWLEEVVNPDSILPDPDAKRPTSSDMKYCFVHETRKVPEFKREFPKARITDFSGEWLTTAPAWISGDQIVLAEYWTITTTERELVLLQGQSGQTMEVDAETIASNKAALAMVVKRRMEPVPKVCMYLTNGVELLDKTDWPGKYIPIASCYGKVIYRDDGSGVERVITSMVDLMRDPQMLNAYLRTNEAELVGMTPKTPFIGYVGQFRTRGDVWAKLNHVPVAFAEVDATTDATGSQILPLPQRQPYDPPIQALEILAESSRRSIQAAAGSSPLPTQAQRRNEKSGVALREMRESAQVGSYHFGDHYNDMIEHVGVMGEDLLDKIIDTARDVPIRKADETTESVRVNDPSDPKSVSTKGDHLVTVSTGPSFESERDAGSDLADTLIGMGDPEYVRAVMPMAIKLKNLGAIGDELVEIAEALQPPQIQALKQKEGEQPTPEQLKAQIAQMQQQIQLAEQAIQELTAKAEGKQLDAESRLQVARIKAESDLKKAELDAAHVLKVQQMRDATALAVAHIAAEAKGVLSAHTAADEALARGEQQAFDATQRELDRQHERELAEQSQAHEAERAAATEASANDREARKQATPPAVPPIQIDLRQPASKRAVRFRRSPDGAIESAHLEDEA